MRLKTYKMPMSILPKFLTLKWNISRTIWRIEVGDGSIFCIFHALSFELSFFFDRRFPLNLFPSSLKASTSNFHISFVGSLVFNLRFENFPNHKFFSDSAENPINTHRCQIWIDLIPLPTLFFGKPKKLSIK